MTGAGVSRQDCPEHPNVNVPGDLSTDRILKGGIGLAPRAELCATIVALCAERDALAAALADIAGMRLVNLGGGHEKWVADAECADMHGICWEQHPDDPGGWCQTCAAEVAWCGWKMGVLAAGSDGATVTGGGVL